VQPNSEPTERTKTSSARDAGPLISSLIKAKKDLQLYPAGNATVSESIQKMLLVLKESYSTEDVVEVLIEKDRVCVNGVETGANDPRTKELALSFFRRNVRKILLDPSIPMDELKLLLRILNTPTEKIAESGGIEKLTKSRNIIHAVVEETPDLMLFDGESFSVPLEILSQIPDETIDGEGTDSTDAFGRMFIRIQQGDPDYVKRLQSLLRKPSDFARLLEKFALQLEKAGEKGDSTSQVDRLLNVLRNVGSAATTLPSEEERADVLQNLAVSVLDLSANIRTELITQGLMPNLALKSIESEILSRFPVSRLADTLVKNLEVSGATSSLMQSYLNSLKLTGNDKAALAGVLREQLDDEGILSADLEEVLNGEETRVETLFSDDEIIFPERPDLHLEYYPSERVLFQGTERAELLATVQTEMTEPICDTMAPILLELLRYEKITDHYNALVAKTRVYMEHYLQQGEYEKAAAFLAGLQAEYMEKRQSFSQVQLKPIRFVIEDYCGEHRIRRLAASFKNMNAEGQEFEGLVKYFEAVGKTAASSLMQMLEGEESRHTRLLICKALAQTGEKSIVVVAEKLKHPKWFVVRNAVSILGQTGSPACVPYLQPILKHEDVRVCKEVLKALASIRSGEAVELLCSSLEDDEPAICKAALGWVAAIEAEQAFPILQRFLTPWSIFKRDEEIVKLSIDALQAIGSEAAVELLERLHRTHSLFRRRRAATIRYFAGAALTRMADES
jgi:HEAT repeat protein